MPRSLVSNRFKIRMEPPWGKIKFYSFFSQFHGCSRFVDIGPYRTLKQIFGTAFLNQAAQNIPIECLSDRFSFFSRIVYPPQCRETTLTDIYPFDSNPQIPEETGTSFRHAFTHEAILKDASLRVFRTSPLEMPRKNGKNSMSSGTGMYCWGADGACRRLMMAVAKHILRYIMTSLASSPLFSNESSEYLNLLSFCRRRHRMEYA